MTARLCYVGLTHAGAPLEIRERLRPSQQQQRAMLDRLTAAARGRFILSTCERFELYLSEPATTQTRLLGMLADWFHLPRRLIARYATCRLDQDVANHLLRVAAGLDSRVLGEPQVLAQLRQAQRWAFEARSLDATLASLTRAAIRTGRRVRCETPINQGRRSIATLAVDEIPAPKAPNAKRNVIVLGSGHLARDVATVIRDRSGSALTIAARNESSGSDLADRLGGVFVPMADLGRAIVDADGLIACTSSSTFVVDPTLIGSRRDKPLTVVDLCVPRNVDPDVTRIPGVRLVHLEDLLRRNMPAVSGMTAATNIVAQELQAFDLWCRQRSVVPQIRDLLCRARQSGLPAMPEARKQLHERIMVLKCMGDRREVAA